MARRRDLTSVRVLLVQKIRGIRRRIPLIFCSSKTRTEVKSLRRAIGNTLPFVAENGGSLVIPAGYFPAVAPSSGRTKNFTLILGRPYDQLVRELREIGRASCRERV